MSNADLETAIEAAWDDRENVNAGTGGAVRDAVETALCRHGQGRACALPNAAATATGS